MTILVTGGAGYIGSVAVEMLRGQRSSVVVLDDLVCGHREALDEGMHFYQGKVGDSGLVAEIVRKHEIGACVHFAACALVGESIANPAKYFNNNTLETTTLLDTLMANGVKKVVFSSTCATYGDPVRIPIDEEHPQRPVNPYGWSKFMTERVLENYGSAYGLRYVSLRYFNAAGATTRHGEDHDPETHLIPNVLAVAMGRHPWLSIFGNDYPTPDGTCVRDYVHVTDLGAAHISALDYLENDGPSISLNLGSGVGFSVMEVVETARETTGKPIETRIESRRTGDPARLVADNQAAERTLGFTPQHSDLETIIGSAWEWTQKNPTGYRRDTIET